MARYVNRLDPLSKIELRGLSVYGFRSPIDGVVLQRAAESGEIYAVGASLLVIANLDKMTLTIYNLKYTA